MYLPATRSLLNEKNHGKEDARSLLFILLSFKKALTGGNLTALLLSLELPCFVKRKNLTWVYILRTNSEVWNCDFGL